MEGLERFKNSVEKLLKRYSCYKPSYGDVEVQLIMDRENHHYQLLNVGWNKDRRVRGCLLHIDIKDGKIWIQHDGTEIGVANELLESGISKEDIVLAFHPPYKRKYTGFALN